MVQCLYPPVAQYQAPPVTLERTAGPLKVSALNPRYLMDRNGKSLVLVGSNYWNLLQDGGRTLPPPRFDYDAFIDFAVSHGYNYLRWHTWEHATHLSEGRRWYIRPTIYERRGTKAALDGEPQFDLNAFNAEFFDRLRSRVLNARDKGLYVAVDLFQGFSVADGNTMSAQWAGHPFNASNNLNGVDGDPTQQGNGRDTQTLLIPLITRYQEQYVAHIIETLGDLDNVIWEVAIEPSGSYSRGGFNSFDWVEHFVKYIQEHEARKGDTHPILYSSLYPGGDNRRLFASSAQIVAPNAAGGFFRDSPVLTGNKVVLVDTDHIEWTETDGADWAWRAFTRGAGGFAIMDGGYSDYDDQGGGSSYRDAEAFRYN